MVFAARQQQTIPLTIERVRKIKSLNRQNIVPEELEAVEVVSTKPKEVEPAFVDVVGQISLRSLERADKNASSSGEAVLRRPARLLMPTRAPHNKASSKNKVKAGEGITARSSNGIPVINRSIKTSQEKGKITTSRATKIQ
ncbi:hypothetical protein LWM68_39275 [Niabella sp. W65]|nr:hypothetical protein [Niabella sp. W65]MCH7368247.1 hypothetical protein [Niabella sp. W65]ULT43852.1 hypothetical protein KRR40_10935 [Niabella sp. I65]